MNVRRIIERYDQIALQQTGLLYYDEGDVDSAFTYLTKAAALCDAVSHFQLSHMYREGNGVEKDEKMEMYHLEEAAIAGHLGARWNLGLFEERKESFARAAKHFIIAANLGCDRSVKALRGYYRDGYLNKDDFEAALRAYQDGVDAMKSLQREEAAKC